MTQGEKPLSKKVKKKISKSCKETIRWRKRLLKNAGKAKEYK
jgi:hypothetical protein